MTTFKYYANTSSEHSKCNDGDPRLEEYDPESKGPEKKATLRKFFNDVLGLWGLGRLALPQMLTYHVLKVKKMASKGHTFGRFPWRRICFSPELYISPGSLPHGFQLKDPESLRAEDIAELWKHICQRQQSGRLNALIFTDEVFKFDASSKSAVEQLPRDASDDKLTTDFGALPPIVAEQSNLYHLLPSRP